MRYSFFQSQFGSIRHIWWSLSNSRWEQIFRGKAAPVLGVLSRLLIRDNHNYNSCEAFSSFLNLYAPHCQELPNYIHSEVLDMRIVVLAAVAIFPPLPMDILGNKYEIHQHCLAQMMLLDLPAWGISCVYWTSVSKVLPSPYLRLPPVLKPTGPGIACQARGESQKPLFALCPSQKKESGIEIDSPALMI